MQINPRPVFFLVARVLAVNRETVGKYSNELQNQPSPAHSKIA